MRDPSDSDLSRVTFSWPEGWTSARGIVHGGLLCFAIVFSASLHAQVNLDFETLSVDEATSGFPSGWDVEDEDAVFELDAVTRRGGTHSLRVTSATERVRFSQVLDPRGIPGERVRVSAYVRAGNVGATGTAGLRVRVEDDTGLIYIDRIQEQIGRAHV